MWIRFCKFTNFWTLCIFLVSSRNILVSGVLETKSTWNTFLNVHINIPSEILKMRDNWFKKYMHSNFNIVDKNSLFVKILNFTFRKNSYLFLVVKLSPHKMRFNWLFTKIDLGEFIQSCYLQNLHLLKHLTT